MRFIRLQAAQEVPRVFLSSKVISTQVGAPPLQAFYFTHIMGDKPILHPIHGYFSSRSRSVGVLERSIKFNQLEGRMGYMRYLDDIYKQSDISWFTPVEIFKKLFEVLHEVLPKMSLIASDFSYLPDVIIPGQRAPLVSTKRDGRSSDYGNYLEAQGDADIFLPTGFWLLERIDHYCSGWLKPLSDSTSKKGKQGRTAGYIIFHGRVWIALKDENQGWIQPPP